MSKRELLVLGRPAEAVVVEVVVAARQRQLAEMAITDDLGAARGRRVAAAGLRPATGAALPSTTIRPRQRCRRPGPRADCDASGTRRELLALVAIH